MGGEIEREKERMRYRKPSNFHASAHKTQSSGRADSKRMHAFAGDEFPHGAAQDCSAIELARKRRAARSFF